MPDQDQTPKQPKNQGEGDASTKGNQLPPAQSAEGSFEENFELYERQASEDGEGSARQSFASYDLAATGEEVVDLPETAQTLPVKSDQSEEQDNESQNGESGNSGDEQTLKEDTVAESAGRDDTKSDEDLQSEEVAEDEGAEVQMESSPVPAQVASTGQEEAGESEQGSNQAQAAEEENGEGESDKEHEAVENNQQETPAADSQEETTVPAQIAHLDQDLADIGSSETDEDDSQDLDAEPDDAEEDNSKEQESQPDEDSQSSEAKADGPMDSSPADSSGQAEMPAQVAPEEIADEDSGESDSEVTDQQQSSADTEEHSDRNDGDSQNTQGGGEHGATGERTEEQNQADRASHSEGVSEGPSEENSKEGSENSNPQEDSSSEADGDNQVLAQVGASASDELDEANEPRDNMDDSETAGGLSLSEGEGNASVDATEEEQAESESDSAQQTNEEAETDEAKNSNKRSDRSGPSGCAVIFGAAALLVSAIVVGPYAYYNLGGEGDSVEADTEEVTIAELAEATEVTEPLELPEKPKRSADESSSDKSPAEEPAAAAYDLETGAAIALAFDLDGDLESEREKIIAKTGELLDYAHKAVENLADLQAEGKEVFGVSHSWERYSFKKIAYEYQTATTATFHDTAEIYFSRQNLSLTEEDDQRLTYLQIAVNYNELRSELESGTDINKPLLYLTLQEKAVEYIEYFEQVDFETELERASTKAKLVEVFKEFEGFGVDVIDVYRQSAALKATFTEVFKP